MDLVIRRVALLAAVVAATVAIGMAGYMWIDKASAFDAFYMALITMTTVGYGETVPLSHAGRVFNSIFLLLSTSVLFIGFGLLAATMVELQLGDLIGRRKVRRMIDKIENHFIVCGLGRVGRGAAKELQRAGVPFVVVDLREWY